MTSAGGGREREGGGGNVRGSSKVIGEEKAAGQGK